MIWDRLVGLGGGVQKEIQRKKRGKGKRKVCVRACVQVREKKGFSVEKERETNGIFFL